MLPGKSSEFAEQLVLGDEIFRVTLRVFAGTPEMPAFIYQDLDAGREFSRGGIDSRTGQIWRSGYLRAFCFFSEKQSRQLPACNVIWKTKTGWECQAKIRE